MTIRELLEATGMDRTTVYFYEKEGLIHPARQANGYRDYSRADLTELQRIKLLRRLGVPLEEIRALQAGERRLPDTLTRRLAELERQQAQTARDQDTCRAIRDAGVARIRINPQTMNDRTLEVIGRRHTVEEVKDKFRLARSLEDREEQSGLIIYGISWQAPGQGTRKQAEACPKHRILPS